VVLNIPWIKPIHKAGPFQFIMETQLILPDNNLQYLSSELLGDTIEVKVASKRTTAICPFCGTPSTNVHSHYTRILQDLPIGGKKVKLLLHNVKYRCLNKDCTHTTFAEAFDFYDPKATVTKRLKAEIIRIARTQDSVSAANYLRENVAIVGKSTICTLLKATGKKRQRAQGADT
jgi:transposase